MCRYFLGVNKFTPNAAVQGDMGVRVPWQHQNVEIARRFCRFKNMTIKKTNKIIFCWANNLHCTNWLQCTKELLHQCTLHDNVDADEIDKGPLLQGMEEGVENIILEKRLGIIKKEGSKCKQEAHGS